MHSLTGNRADASKQRYAVQISQPQHHNASVSVHYFNQMQYIAPFQGKATNQHKALLVFTGQMP